VQTRVSLALNIFSSAFSISARFLAILFPRLLFPIPVRVVLSSSHQDATVVERGLGSEEIVAVWVVQLHEEAQLIHHLPSGVRK
jgi:hypothetical protein